MFEWDNGKEYITVYANIDEAKVRVGQEVKKGEIIALSGNSGNTTGPHLHYEVIHNGEYVDPKLYFTED